MPGLNILLAKRIDDSLLNNAKDDLISPYCSSARVLFQSRHFAVVFAGNEHYPLWCFENDHCFFAVEGLIYNHTEEETQHTLRLIADDYIGGKPYHLRISTLLEDADGDFLAVIFSKKDNRFVCFNDRYGRLHSFYAQTSSFAVISRELKFILHFLPSITVDRIGLANFLMFEYILGNKTLFESVFRLEGSSCFSGKYDSSEGSIQAQEHCILPLRFDRGDCRSDTSTQIGHLRDLFLESTRWRYERLQSLAYSMISDVSGGYDTRTVMGGLCGIGADVDYYTHDLVTGNERKASFAVGELYGKEISLITADRASMPEMYPQISYAMDCLVNAWTSSAAWCDIHDKSSRLAGKVACFNGFGGEFIRHPYTPLPGYHSLESMLRDDLLHKYVSLNGAAAVASVHRDDLMGWYERYFRSYVEDSLEGQLTHLYNEYYYKLVAAGEDRARRLFWTVQPLWGSKFYSYIVKRVPLGSASYSFYTNFMEAVDSKLLEAPIHGSKVVLTNPAFVRLSDVLKKTKSDYLRIVTSRKMVKSMTRQIRTRQRHHSLAPRKDSIRKSHRQLRTFSSLIDDSAIEVFCKNEYLSYNYRLLETLLLYFRQIELRFGSKIK
jgi:asparagine synthase (glutamine-hydrolysing)